MMIENIKCLFLKHPADTVLFGRNVSYSELVYIGDKAYTEVNDSQVSHFGYIYALKADYLIYNPADVERYKQYDIVITRDYPHAYLPAKFRPDQLFLYEEIEPPDITRATWGRVWDAKNTEILHPYDYLLNLYVLNTNNPRNIPTTMFYDLDFYNRIPSQKDNNKVFLQKRGIKGSRAGWFGNYQFPPHYKIVKEWTDEMGIGRNSYLDYCRELKTCSYMINNDWNESHGQVTAEASLLDVISFAPAHKSNTRRLLPEYCWFTTLEEVIKKIAELEGNETMKNDILNQIRENTKKIDYHVFREDALSLYEKFLANGKKV